jgi:hypothetical protein
VRATVGPIGFDVFPDEMHDLFWANITEMEFTINGTDRR